MSQRKYSVSPVGGLYMTMIDVANIGTLMLQKCVFETKKGLPEDHVALR